MSYKSAALVTTKRLAIVVVVIAFMPLIAILINSAQVSGGKWRTIFSSSVPSLLWNTIKLAFLVGAITVIFGVSVAWLLSRYRFRGSKIVAWVLILPLTIPTYVYAYIYTNLFSPSGWFGAIGKFWFTHVENSAWLKAIASIWARLTGDSPDMGFLSNLTFTALILSLATFPYIFLLVLTALRRSTRSLEEVARLQGLSPRQIFWRVNFPLIRPALAAGIAIVLLHTISDFGAVSMMQYPTFTWEIYMKGKHALGSSDYGSAAVLSVVLIVIAFSLLSLERFYRGRQRFYPDDNTRSDRDCRPLSKLQLSFVWFWLGLIILFAAAIPLLWLLVKSYGSFQLGYINAQFMQYTFNSFWIAACVASLALVIALPVAIYHNRRANSLSLFCMQGANVGFILPGPVVAIGVLLVVAFFIQQFGVVAFVTAWIVAVVIRFLPLAVQAEESALQQVTPSIERAGRALGLSAWQNLKKVVLPIISHGLAAAWVLVFIDALKELPIALMINQPGLTTLPIRIWSQADNETLEVAAPAALMLILVALPTLWLIMRPRYPKIS